MYKAQETAEHVKETVRENTESVKKTAKENIS